MSGALAKCSRPELIITIQIHPSFGWFSLSIYKGVNRFVESVYKGILTPVIRTCLWLHIQTIIEYTVGLYFNWPGLDQNHIYILNVHDEGNILRGVSGPDQIFRVIEKLMCGLDSSSNSHPNTCITCDPGPPRTLKSLPGDYNKLFQFFWSRQCLYANSIPYQL